MVNQSDMFWHFAIQAGVTALFSYLGLIVLSNHQQFTVAAFMYVASVVFKYAEGRRFAKC